MADVAVSFAVKTLGNLAIKKVCFLLDIEEKVKCLKEELEMSQSLLRDAAEKQAYDNRMSTFISSIRKAAQEADDVIETFILKIDNPRSSRGLIRRCLSFPCYLYHLIKVGGKIASIQDKLQQVTTRLHQYKSQTIDNGILPTPSENVDEQRPLFLKQKDEHPVGLEEDSEKIKRVVLEAKKGRSIVSIAGMGGIGKSTLAIKVYNHFALTDRFDCSAWVRVSRKFKPQDVIMDLMRHLTGHDLEMPIGISEESQIIRLRNMLYEYLQGRKYFIVIDNLWESTHWESLESAFPDEGDKASILLLTSRKRDIAAARYVHSMKHLDRKESWQLLLKKALLPHNMDDKCPKELEYFGKKILERCSDLPLAITKVGELLARMGPDGSKWENVFKHLNYNLETSKVQAILELSYNNLSPQLKSCFLCLGFFNDGAPIRAEKLVQVWIAEGLVSDEGQVKAEDVARRYLDELINQNMIQVMEMTIDDQVKKCGIQEFLLKLSITKAIEEISFEILKEKENSQSLDKHRHRSVYCSTKEFAYSMTQNTHLRSLFFHGLGKVNCSPSSYWKSFRLLRVLDFEDFGLEKLPGRIGALIGLRYLGLRNNKLRKLPRSLCHLKKLEVLDIALNSMEEVPDIIWKMHSLRHVYMSGIKCKVPLKIDMKKLSLENLHTLMYIPMAYWKPEDMTRLQKLGIELDENSDASEFCNSLQKVPTLVELDIKGSYKQSMASLTGLDILHHLTKLKLHGWLASLPHANGFPPNLSCLSLVHTYLDEDPMLILEKLENLRYLRLHQAYTGDKMTISGNGFHMLKVLSLHRLKRLNTLEVGEGALQELRRLEIKSCFLLESLPEQVTGQLQELEMVTTKQIASKLRSLGRIPSNIKSVNLIGS